MVHLSAVGNVVEWLLNANPDEQPIVDPITGIAEIAALIAVLSLVMYLFVSANRAKSNARALHLLEMDRIHSRMRRE